MWLTVNVNDRRAMYFWTIHGCTPNTREQIFAIGPMPTVYGQ